MKKDGSKNEKVKIDKERCKGCGLCVEFCPVGALDVSEDVNKKGAQPAFLRHPDKCTGCGICLIMCPDCSLFIVDKDKDK